MRNFLRQLALRFAQRRGTRARVKAALESHEILTADAVCDYTGLPYFLVRRELRRLELAGEIYARSAPVGTVYSLTNL